MSAAWVAGSVRARAMARRRLGPGGCHALAGLPSLEEALASLAATPYGHDVTTEQSLAEAQHAVAATTLWNLRVLAGWLPRLGGEQLRVLAGWFEVANADEVLAAMSGRPTAPLFRLGHLGTVADRLAQSTSPEELREVLATSPWGDPRGTTPAVVAPALRLSWAERIVAAVPPARPWALGAAALLVARERFAAGSRLPDAAAESARRLLGTAADAPSLAELTTALPADARWALSGIDAPDDLWRAEARWWTRLDTDAGALLRAPRFEFGPALGAAAAAAVDAWRVCAALECAARGGDEEAFDAVA